MGSLSESQALRSGTYTEVPVPSECIKVSTKTAMQAKRAMAENSAGWIPPVAQPLAGKVEAAAVLQHYHLDWSPIQLVLPPPARPLAKCQPLAAWPTSPTGTASSWSVEDMVAYLEAIKLGHLGPAIKANGLDGHFFLQCTQADLEPIGIGPLLLKKIMLYMPR